MADILRIYLAGKVVPVDLTNVVVLSDIRMSKSLIRKTLQLAGENE